MLDTRTIQTGQDSALALEESEVELYGLLAVLNLNDRQGQKLSWDNGFF